MQIELIHSPVSSTIPFPPTLNEERSKRWEAARSVTLVDVPPHGREHEGVGKKNSPLEKLIHSTKNDRSLVMCQVLL